MQYRQSEQLNNTPLEVVKNTPQTLVVLAFEPRGGGGLNRLIVRKEVFYAKH